MKIFKLFAFALIATAFWSCSSSSSVDLKADGVEGENSEAVTIKDKTCTLNFDEDKDATTLIMKVTLSLAKPLDAEEIDDIELGYGPKVKVFDENGKDLVELDFGTESLDSNAATELKKFLKSEAGTEKEFTFSKKVSDKDEIKDIAEKGSSFKVTDFDAKAGPKEMHLNLSGAVGNNACMMTIDIDKDQNITGAYCYKKYASMHQYLYLKGTKNGDNISLKEYNQDGMMTGSFEGTYVNGEFSGTWSCGFDSRTLSFSLKDDANMAPLDYSDVNVSSFEYSSGSDDGGSYDSDMSEGDGGNIDELLDSYEEYVDQYISLMQKAANGDPSAALEYGEYLQKAQDLSDKLSNVNGTMTSAQLQRYNSINMKMANAASNM